ncbi:MAG TPA: hypothetical protein VMM76_05705 [Pirellulaceae bacterium]|nr:hypothetical protein [Pirellulaceae bacterium]
MSLIASSITRMELLPNAGTFPHEFVVARDQGKADTQQIRPAARCAAGRRLPRRLSDNATTQHLTSDNTDLEGTSQWERRSFGMGCFYLDEVS